MIFISNQGVSVVSRQIHIALWDGKHVSVASVTIDGFHEAFFVLN